MDHLITLLNDQMDGFLLDGWLIACLDLELIQIFNLLYFLWVIGQRTNAEKNLPEVEVKFERKRLPQKPLPVNNPFNYLKNN